MQKIYLIDSESSILHSIFNTHGKSMWFYRKRNKIRKYEISFYESYQKNFQSKFDWKKSETGRWFST